jgi:hypothetical protein
MNVTQTHKLEFRNNQPPTINELKGVLAVAEKAGFSGDTPVYIRAGTDDRDRDYYFVATIGADGERMP